MRAFELYKGLISGKRVAFSPNGEHILAVRYSDRALGIWEIAYGGIKWKNYHPYPIINKIDKISYLESIEEQEKINYQKAKHLISISNYREAYQILRETQNNSKYGKDLQTRDLIYRCNQRGRRLKIRDYFVIDTFKGHTSSIKSIKPLTSGSLLISGSDDATLRLWDINTRQVLRIINFEGYINSIYISPDESSFLTAGHKQMRLWDLETGKIIADFFE